MVKECKHCWVLIGTIGIKPIYEVYKCHWCNKGKTEELDMLIKIGGSDGKC